MRIRNNQKQVPWFNRKDQYRMLMLVAALGFVLFAMKRVSQPNFWAWMFAGQQQTKSEPTKKQTSDNKISYSAKFEKSTSLPPDAFRSTKSSPEEENTTKTKPTEAATLSIPPKQLINVVDDRIGFRATEASAYYTVLAKVRDLPVDAVQQAAEKDIPFESLIIDTNRHRGKLIHLQGQARRVLQLEAKNNDQNIQQLYELWMFTADSGIKPIHVVCTELPKGIPMGEKIEPIDITVYGYFFKREGYDSNAGLRIAPLILAKSPQWHQPVVVASQKQQDTMTPYIIGGVIAGILLICLIVWRSRAGDRQFDEKFRMQHAEKAEAAVATLKDNVDYTSLDDMFQQLKDEEK